MARTGTRKTAPLQRRQPQQNRSSHTVDTLLDAAARVLREEGMEAFNTNRIAERAGIGIGSLYEYFSGKRSLLVALARQLHAQDQAALRSALATPQGADPVETLVRALFARHTADRQFRLAVMSVHISEGLGHEQRDQIESFVDVLAAQSGFDGVAPLRLMVAAQATLGIARAIADGTFDAWGNEDDLLVRESTALVQRFLAHGLLG